MFKCDDNDDQMGEDSSILSLEFVSHNAIAMLHKYGELIMIEKQEEKNKTNFAHSPECNCLCSLKWIWWIWVSDYLVDFESFACVQKKLSIALLKQLTDVCDICSCYKSIHMIEIARMNRRQTHGIVKGFVEQMFYT